MSRHQISGDPEIVVGWDQPMKSFFIHFYDREGELVWEEGGDFRELYDMDALEAACRRRGIRLPVGMPTTLCLDADLGR